eukprot:m.49751 g.49751  ORF g.49751 m.49751 type:complete len:69 (+) comp17948_c0_seq2:524-730(+)
MLIYMEPSCSPVSLTNLGILPCHADQTHCSSSSCGSMASVSTQQMWTDGCEPTTSAFGHKSKSERTDK